MAWKWQIRHKLMIGLGLVVGIMSLLLGGTLKGLASYRATMNSMDSKIAELKSAQQLKQRVSELDSMKENPRASELPIKADQVRHALDEYELRLKDTLENKRDPDKGYLELQMIEAIRKKLVELGGLIKDARKHIMDADSLTDEKKPKEEMATILTALGRDADDLLDSIYHDLDKRHVEAKPQYRTSMVILFSTSILGTLLMIGLVRFFYNWVFNPLRDLQLGAGRVAQGDFNHRIEVHSGDEMEDVARAFNHMTDQLQMIYADLARQVNERSRQLVRSERLASVGFLAAGVAHEINNPLASITFCSEALESRLAAQLPALRADPARTDPDSDAEVIRRYLKMIQQEAFRCKKITERLLEFSRGGEKLREPTNLADLVTSVLEVVQHLQNGKGKEVIFEPDGHVVAWVNAQEIKSVVLNLVVNALDSMEEGGRLSIKLCQRDGMAIVEFADTGCGMSAEVLENIFEPFFTRSRTGKGTGLGLTISHRIVSQHGGEIEAASRGPNQGSTFTVHLPLQPVEPVKEELLGHAAA